MGAAGDRYVAARIRHQTSERPQDLAGARAHLARDGDDFTAARAQSEIRNVSWYGQLVDNDEALAGFVVTPLEFTPLGDLPSMSSTMLCRYISAAGCEAIIRPSRSAVT